jgi:tRNA-specific adenosine deaminase 3
MQIVAKATDQTHKHDTPEGNTVSEANADVTCSLNESMGNGSNLSLPGSFLPKCDSLNMEISCINPWGWMKKKTCERKPLPCDGCFAWHPLRHAPMVAIENAAERDRTMFPSLASITKTDSNGNLEKYCDNEQAKRLKTDTKVSLVDSYYFSLQLLT